MKNNNNNIQSDILSNIRDNLWVNINENIWYNTRDGAWDNMWCNITNNIWDINNPIKQVLKNEGYWRKHQVEY